MGTILLAELIDAITGLEPGKRPQWLTGLLPRFAPPRLGEALTVLIQGTLPDPPLGTWWLLGMPGGLRTIAMDVDHLG
jgi:hypothetical protein